MLPIRQIKQSRGRTATKEDLEFEIKFFEGIAHHDPDYIEALQILGDAYTKTGQWEKGLKIDKQLAKLCPDNALVFYNLACSHSLLKHPDEAFAALQQAIQLGYDDVRWFTRDPDLDNLRQDHRYQTIRADLARKFKTPLRSSDSSAAAE